ncbi:MAG TPA: hypothetical protein VMI30_13675 [Stellaceae bacterium]|nr:hypothetical protein [Stellaceae bacterium]
MALYLPGLPGLLAVVITCGIAAILLLMGSAVAGKSVAPEFRIVAGWGALCLVLTAWGVFLPASLRIPALAVVVLALAAQAMPSRRVTRADAIAFGRLLLVTLPLWVVMAGVRPSQVDSFLNLLPNADYLADYARLPTAALPPSHSFLPAAPYNTQFLAFLGSLVWRDYPAAGMSLANVMLRLVAGMAIARVLARPAAAPGWGALALGILLVTLFDPGFVPRFDFSAYGETALAVTALLSACLFVEARGGWAHWVVLSLILAPMINTKQSGIGLVLAVAGAAVVTGFFEDRGQWRQLFGRVLVVLLPAAALYLVWRYFVAHAGVAELEPLPFRAWNWSLLPETFESIGWSIGEKPTYFIAELASFVSLAFQLRRGGWSRTTRYLAFNAATFVLYNGFLVVTYIAHFSTEMAAEAHSYFRYNTHLSLLLVLSLALVVCDLLAPLWASSRAKSQTRGRGIAVFAVVLALVAPVAFAERLRFDIEMPQPLVWNLADELRPYLHDGQRLALLLPGDNGEIGDLLAGYLAIAPPRRRGLVLTRYTTADAATLDKAAAAGETLAVVTCTPDALLGLPPKQAALLRRDASGGWRAVATRPYGAGIPLSHWQRNRHWPALCR